MIPNPIRSLDEIGHAKIPDVDISVWTRVGPPLLHDAGNVPPDARHLERRFRDTGWLIEGADSQWSITTVTAAIASARRLTIVTGRCTAPNMIESIRVFKSPPRTPETKKGRFAISVLRRTLDAFDDQLFNQASRRLQFQTQLLLQRRWQ